MHLRLRFFLIMFILGCIYRIAEYKGYFALSNYEIISDSPELEKRLWEVFPNRCIKFWPYIYWDAKGFEEFLMRDIPVNVRTEIKFTGKIKTVIKYLQSWLKVEWRGHIWSISRDGRMWLADESEENKLIWKLPESANIGDEFNLQINLNGIFRAPFSTEIMRRFQNDFENYEWFKNANEITWERRAGYDLFKLQINNAKQNLEIHVQREKYLGQDLGEIIQEIYKRALREGGNKVIDATYEGKVLLRKL